MKTIRFYLIILITSLLISPILSFGQSVSPAPGNSTICPGEGVFYTINPNPDFSGCSSFTWTLENGSFNFGSKVTSKVTSSNVFTVTVYWDDIAGTGTLKVTAPCANNTTMSVGPLSYAIRSLAGRVPANARASQTLAFCTSNTINLAVDVMFLNNTGGATGVSQERADGYEWVLPTGWKSNGTAGTISTPTEFITITPDNGCSGGSVTVKAYKNCGTKKYSSSASISVSRLTPSIQVAPPAGYTGPICGATQAVTFTVTPIPCATNYSWAFSGPNAQTPSGWAATPVSTSTNFINVQPSGTPTDAGSLKVTITLDCGTQLISNAYNLIIKPRRSAR